MNGSFELAAPEQARSFLHSLGQSTRHKGEAYFNQHRVKNLRSEENGTCISADVRGAELYLVTLLFHRADGWGGECTCPLESHCKHVYAVMQAALIESRGTGLSQLNGGAPAQVPPRTTPPATATLSAGNFSQKVAQALQRPLRSPETSFLRKVNQLYQRCRQSHRISRWDFEELGLSLGGYGWDTLEIWPSFPAQEEEFWLYVANAVLEHGRKIPEFMEPVTRLETIQDRLKRWRRTREINGWKATLGKRPQTPSALAPALDLRLVLLGSSAELHWDNFGKGDFEPLKNSRARQLMNDIQSGGCALAPEAEVLWQVFENRPYSGGTVALDFSDGEGERALNRLLRLNVLEARIVTEEGEPLARISEPLHWRVTPANNDNEDYQFFLAQANGTPPPRILCALPGHPTLYLTKQALFLGPPCTSVLDPARVTSIPAPAIESSPGVAFLQSIGLPVPQRLESRIRSVPMRVTISCELQPLYPGSPSENCLFSIEAEAADGTRTEKWTGQTWLDTPTRQAGRSKSPSDLITVYDRGLMNEVPRLLQPLGLKYDGFSSRLCLRVTKRFPEIFVPWIKSLPSEIRLHLAGILASLAQEDVSGRVRLDVTEADIDWFDLHVVLDVSDTTLTPDEIRLLLNAKGGYVRLDENGWRRLQFDLTDEDDEKLARLGLNPHELTAEPQRLHALQLADGSARKFLPEQQVEQIHRRVGEIKARVTPDLPGTVTAQLRPYQIEGFHFLAYLAANRFGGILADDMGLGKTLQALVWLAWLREQHPGGILPHNSETGSSGSTGDNQRSCCPPSLVVCPKSVMDNWSSEAQRFTAGLRVKTWAAAELNTFLDRLNEADLHVLNYSQLRIVGESLVPIQWLSVILDEGQYIKNPNSQTAQIARALRAQHRLVLSGTPIENRLLDLWSLMSFAMPGVLGSRHHFAKLFDAKEDPFARRRLSARVRPFLLRRTKSQVAKDLPDRIEEDLFCEIEGEQKALYRAELKRAQQMLLRVQTQKDLAKQRFHFLTSLLRLRQICCHPALVKPESKSPSAKLEALLEQIEPVIEEGHKVLVFSQFVEMLALIQTAVAGRGWPMFYLAGETENRGELVERFQTTEGAAVFLISLKAGGFGLNLTAASYVVLFDPWWNPAVENQAIDRTHRIGQSNKVIAYRLLIKDTIEEKIRILQKQKSALAEDVLGEEKFSQSLTLDDLQFLFAD